MRKKKDIFIICMAIYIGILTIFNFVFTNNVEYPS